jgi:hypothetical protein
VPIARASSPDVLLDPAEEVLAPEPREPADADVRKVAAPGEIRDQALRDAEQVCRLLGPQEAILGQGIS